MTFPARLRDRGGDGIEDGRSRPEFKWRRICIPQRLLVKDRDGSAHTLYASGSPYAWRVWLAAEHKGIAYELKTLSFDAGDLKRPGFLALNPRHRVPVIVDNDFTL